jgi:hypothetical protein
LVPESHPGVNNIKPFFSSSLPLGSNKLGCWLLASFF